MGNRNGNLARDIRRAELGGFCKTRSGRLTARLREFIPEEIEAQLIALGQDLVEVINPSDPDPDYLLIGAKLRSRGWTKI